MRCIATLLVFLAATVSIASESGPTGGDASAGKSKAMTCAACHGQDGKTALTPDYPNLAGQNERYLLGQLQMIKSGERAAPLMAGQLVMFSDDDLADLAAYYASLPGKIGEAQNESLELGQRIYRGGILEKGVAACSACHAPTGSGNAPAGFPRLSGQSLPYLVAQLTAYREGQRQTDDEFGGMMRQVAAGLTDTEIRAVANYVLGLH